MRQISTFCFSGLLVLFSSSIKAQTYCKPVFTSCASNNYIQSVTVGGLSNSVSTCNTVWDYTSKSGSIDAGDTISMNVTCKGWDGVAIFVDLNNDGDLTDAQELLYAHYKAPTPPISYTFDITVPANTTAGNHRLRVMCGNGGSVSTSPNPCQGVQWGNYHDYTLVVKNNCPTDSNLAVSNQTDTSAVFSWAPRAGVGYEYVLDTNAGSPMGSGTPTTATTFSANNLIAGIHYYFHIRTSCGNGIYSAWGVVDFVACTLPDADINLSGKQSLCRPDTLVLEVPLDTNFTYQWYFNGSKFSGETNNKLEVATFPASYFVVVKKFPGCETMSATAVVAINNKPPVPSINISGFTISTNPGYANYEWYLDGNLIPGASAFQHIALSNGQYQVVVIDTNGCSEKSQEVSMIGVGIADNTEESIFKVYPNPAHGQLTVKSNKERHGQVVLKSLMGQVIMQKSVVLILGETAIDLPTAYKGLYLLNFQLDESAYNQRIVLD